MIFAALILIAAVFFGYGLTQIAGQAMVDLNGDR